MYICVYIYIYASDVYIYIYIYIYGSALYDICSPSASVQWQPDGLTIRAKKWFLGAGFLGAPPISLRNVFPFLPILC